MRLSIGFCRESGYVILLPNRGSRAKAAKESKEAQFVLVLVLVLVLDF